MGLLVKMELQKINGKKYFLLTILLVIGLCFMSTVAIFGTAQDGKNDYISVLKMINAAIMDCYIIFSGILCCNMLVEEYEKRTILLLFTYPFKKIQMIIAKIIVVVGITVILAFITEIICFGYICVVDKFFDLIEGIFTIYDFSYWSKQLIISLLMLSFFSLIAIAVAIAKKSSSWVYVSSLFMVIIIQIIISQTENLSQFFTMVLICGVLIIGLLISSLKLFLNKLDG